ncbi:MAG: fatty acid desaturase family protein [Acidimicrobiales bacterium]
MQSVTADAGIGSFRSLAREVRQSGLLDRRTAYYVTKINLTVAAYAAGWATLVLVRNSWVMVAVAAFMGFVYAQLGFLGHDAGHQQVFRSQRGNRLLGLAVGNALIGVSFGWWVPKHNAHHAFPNQIGRDPDIGDGLVIVPTEGSSGPGRSLALFLARRQALVFFPLMLLRSSGLYLYSTLQLLRRHDRSAAIEATSVLLSAALYFTTVVWVLSPWKALVFLAVHQAVFSILLGCSFAPNHKGMALLLGDEAMGFARRQVTTSRNVTGGPLLTFVMGGLNYQIEHHLFPTMPRPNLVRAQPLVRSFCASCGLRYSEDTPLGSFRRIIRHLSDTAPAVPAASPGFVTR